MILDERLIPVFQMNWFLLSCVVKTNELQFYRIKLNKVLFLSPFFLHPSTAELSGGYPQTYQPLAHHSEQSKKYGYGWHKNDGSEPWSKVFPCVSVAWGPGLLQSPVLPLNSIEY
jgi:hypothetical protein